MAGILRYLVLGGANGAPIAATWFAKYKAEMLYIL